jgi:hypothetical protein
VWEKTMPRIPTELLNTVIYLYHSETDARLGRDAGGSGLLSGIPVPTGDGAWIYAVTNAHVSKEAPVVRINKADGTVGIFPFISTDWVDHPDGITDLSATNLDLGQVDTYKISGIWPSWFAIREAIEAFKINLGDDTILLGRFINRDGKLRNLPSVRAGIISQMADPDDPIDTEAGPQEAYLVETRSISGYSGSPIFVWIPALRYAKGAPPGTMIQDVLLFLGIDCAHVPDYSRVLDAKCNEKHPAEYVETNTGMAIVIPSYKLQELLDCDELKEQRAKDMEQENRKRPRGKLYLAGRPKQSTTPIEGEPIEIPIPTRNQFFDDLAKATRKREQKD